MRERQPFFRTQTQSWYVHHAGLMVSLGKEESEAKRKWHELKSKPAPAPLPGRCETVADRAAAFERHAAIHDRNRVELTSEYGVVGDALARFCDVCGDVQLDKLSRRDLKRFQSSLVDAGLARTTINGYVGRVRRMFRWGRSEEIRARRFQEQRNC